MLDNPTKLSRRDALKLMGTAAMTLAISASGISALTSCKEKGKMVKRLIFYFTATGNCLHVARELGENIISIPQALKDKKTEYEADEIGIVYPIYGHMPPKIVKRFIENVSLKARYKFAILTYGNRKCNATEIWRDDSHAAGYDFDYITTVKMVDNFLPSFDMNEQMRIDKHIPEQLAVIKADLEQHKQWIQPVTEEERQIHADFMARAGGLLMIQSQDLLEITDNCIDCGFCTKVCPRGNFSFTSEGIETSGDCEFCLACAQNCPQKAIILKNGEKNPNARYRHPDISINDIVRANRQ